MGDTLIAQQYSRIAGPCAPTPNDKPARIDALHKMMYNVHEN